MQQMQEDILYPDEQQGETASVLHTKARFYLEELHNHWIGRGDPRLWPPSLPNLAPTDYFFFLGGRGVC
jgi:hypothetical protein